MVLRGNALAGYPLSRHPNFGWAQGEEKQRNEPEGHDASAQVRAHVFPTDSQRSKGLGLRELMSSCKKVHRMGQEFASMDVESLKKEAGIAACAYVESGMKVGLGTGSTVKYTILELGRRVTEEGLEIVGVPTSVATRDLALQVGIDLVSLDDLTHLDVVIDGTDEFDPAFQLIKGEVLPCCAKKSSHKLRNAWWSLLMSESKSRV